MSLVLMSALALKRQRASAFFGVPIPEDLRPYISRCDSECLHSRNAASNHETCLYLLMKRRDVRLPHIAAALGRLDYLEYAHENGYVIKPWVYENAARYGHLHCLKYLFEKGYPWKSSTIYAAAENGHAECLEFAIKNGCSCYLCLIAILSSANNGHIACLKVLLETSNYPEDNCRVVLDNLHGLREDVRNYLLTFLR